MPGGDIMGQRVLQASARQPGVQLSTARDAAPGGRPGISGRASSTDSFRAPRRATTAISERLAAPGPETEAGRMFPDRSLAFGGGALSRRRGGVRRMRRRRPEIVGTAEAPVLSATEATAAAEWLPALRGSLYLRPPRATRTDGRQPEI